MSEEQYKMWITIEAGSKVNHTTVYGTSEECMQEFQIIKNAQPAGSTVTYSMKRV
jgi:hypothetical protein